MKVRAGLAALLVAPMLFLAGCQAGLSSTGEPLTVEQAELLAQTRFRFAAEGERVVDVSVGAADDVAHVTAHLTVDFDDGLAWGSVQRGPADLAVTEQVAYTPDAYFVDDGGGWRQSASPSPLLGIVFLLGADRPENAQLLRQSDARFLGRAQDDGRDLDVFRSPGADDEPARTRLWLADDGELRRLDAGDDEILVIRPSADAPQPHIPEIDDALGLGDD